MTYLEEYWSLIERREVVVGYWIREAMRNLISELDDPAYIYDTTEAHKRIRFMETMCLQSKAPYYMKPLTLMPWQKAWWEAVYSYKMADTELRRFTEGLLEIARKNGKALDLSTRVPTPTGDRTIADIEPGDWVFGSDGLPKIVNATSPVFYGHKCYRVEFEDGETIIADSDHLWLVREKLNHGFRFSVKSTGDLSADYSHARKDKKGNEYRYRVPIPGAVQYDEKDLPIHPYILGLWIGDGISDGTRIVCGAEDIAEITGYIRKCGIIPTVRERSGHFLISLGGRQGKRSDIASALRDLKLKGNKHIPDLYLTSSISQRWELLCGIMDTDGTCSKSGQCEFVQKNQTIVNDFSALLSSLGIKHSVKRKIATCDGKRIPVFRILFYVDSSTPCFWLKRKAERIKDRLSGRMNYKSIVRVDEVESVPTKCLCVDGGLFLCGERNTVTHNSTMFAGDGNCDLFVGEGGSDICCASNDDRQARLIWSEIAGMRSRLDPKKAVTSQNLVQIRNFVRNITVFRLSSRTQNKDGFNISKTYLDESHDIDEENGQSEIAEACWRGMSSKDEPLFLNCTTQGFNRDCYLDHKISYAKKVISGEIDDPHFLAFLYEQDSEQEVWQDERSWEKSNPSIRYGVKKIAKLRRDVEAARHDKATRIHLLTKDFDIPQTNAQSWLMLEDYDYPQDAWDPSEFSGSFYLGAVDLAATTDLANAKALLMKPDTKTRFILSHYFIPESKLESSDDKEAGADYREWARQGFLTICEGNDVDIAGVADWFYSLYKDFKLRPYKIGYDQRYAKVFLDRCEEYGFDTEMLAQGRNLSNAMKLTEADLKSHLINYRANPVDRWCLSNCCCEVDNVGQIQPVKPAGLNSKRIDGAVTLIMATEVLRRYRSDYNKLIGR